MTARGEEYAGLVAEAEPLAKAVLAAYRGTDEAQMVHHMRAILAVVRIDAETHANGLRGMSLLIYTLLGMINQIASVPGNPRGDVLEAAAVMAMRAIHVEAQRDVRYAEKLRTSPPEGTA